MNKAEYTLGHICSTLQLLRQETPKGEYEGVTG